MWEVWGEGEVWEVWGGVGSVGRGGSVGGVGSWVFSFSTPKFGVGNLTDQGFIAKKELVRTTTDDES
ncbi:MAG: hypothetical protein F6K40_22180 [Okeania sp. SIO3I5]|uniref:hypothetical protein n=1 Tax=Okeania sp. SIO3I5 TaxID=2607805 RepID=UPI0013BD29A2|nr:hypothetical protein [Okeania sp. SIO3I5]NEQ38831.1 hypothetical protein [Okeania sp. SIO3I5]